jgi:hypothetical protein
VLQALKDNNRGIVFVTVLILIIVAMVLTVTIMSLNISQVTSSEDEVQHIQAEILSTGGLARMFVNQMSGAPPAANISYSETLGTITFDVFAGLDPSGTPPVGSNSAPVNIDVNF